MSSNEFPNGWITAEKLSERSEDEDEGATTFNDHGTLYVTGGERTDEWVWMEDIPEGMENHC